MLGVPALIGGIPILLKLASTVTVLFLVAGFYLGLSSAVRDDDMAGALAAVSGLVALGGFIVGQWMRVPAAVADPPEDPVRQRLLPQRQQQRRHLRLHHRRGRGAGMQGGVSGLLFPAGAGRRADRGRARPAHRSLAASRRSAPTSISSATTRWQSSTGSGCCGATATGSSVPPLDEALVRLDRIWDNFFPFDNAGRARPTSGVQRPARRYPTRPFAAAPTRQNRHLSITRNARQ